MQHAHSLIEISLLVCTSLGMKELHSSVLAGKAAYRQFMLERKSVMQSLGKRACFMRVDGQGNPVVDAPRSAPGMRPMYGGEGGGSSGGGEYGGGDAQAVADIATVAIQNMLAMHQQQAQQHQAWQAQQQIAAQQAEERHQAWQAQQQTAQQEQARQHQAWYAQQQQAQQQAEQRHQAWQGQQQIMYYHFLGVHMQRPIVGHGGYPQLQPPVHAVVPNTLPAGMQNGPLGLHFTGAPGYTGNNNIPPKR